MLPDSQCGFWQSCFDMIFVAKQLVEKARKHNHLLTLFIDLKKAYETRQPFTNFRQA